MNLDLQTIKSTAMWVLIAIAVIGLVLAIVIKKIVGKIITLVLAAVIVLFGWQQRSKVVDFGSHLQGNLQSAACKAHPNFFGINVTYPGC